MTCSSHRRSTRRRRPTDHATIRGRLLTRASWIAMAVALRPRGWAAPGLLALGLTAAPIAVLGDQIIDLAADPKTGRIYAHGTETCIIFPMKG